MSLPCNKIDITSWINTLHCMSTRRHLTVFLHVCLTTSSSRCFKLLEMISSRVAEGQFLSNTVRFGHEANVPRTTIKSDKKFKGVQSLVVQMPIYMSNSGESRMKQNITIQARLHQGIVSITLLGQFCQLCHCDL